MRYGGLYLLALPLPEGLELQVGHLGVLRMCAGSYLYTGSARQGLWQRVARHLRHDKIRRWHVDHLTGHVGLDRPWALLLPDHPGSECGLHAEVGKLLGARLTSPGFGSSDCRCVSHLWHLPALSPADVLPLVERANGPSVEEVARAHPWRPLRGCPGRWVLDAPRPVRLELAAFHAAALAFRTERDPVWVRALPGGGLITWLREDGPLHTLCDEAGFERKLGQLGLTRLVGMMGQPGELR